MVQILAMMLGDLRCEEPALFPETVALEPDQLASGTIPAWQVMVQVLRTATVREAGLTQIRIAAPMNRMLHLTACYARLEVLGRSHSDCMRQ